MLKKIILFIVFNSIVFADLTSSSGVSTIRLTSLEPITITANNSELDFGENYIEAGKKLTPNSPISLTVAGVYSKSVSVKVPKKIDLVSASNNENKIIFSSSLTGDGRDAVISGDTLIWNSGTKILGTDPINLEFSGGILLTNLEEVGTYKGIVRIEVEYN